MGYNLVVIRKHSLQTKFVNTASVLALGKTSRERVMGHLSGRAEGTQGIPLIEHRMSRG